MKKLILFCFFTLFLLKSNAQLTGSGWPNDNPHPQYDALHNQINGGGWVQCISCTSITNSNGVQITVDAGTSIYIKSFSVAHLAWCTGYIYRVGGFWYISVHGATSGGYGSYYPYYSYLTRTVNQVNTIHPPCSAIWSRYNTAQGLYGNTFIGTFSGNTCSQVFGEMTSATILPNLIHLPNLTSSQINSIPNPKPGMITFDINEYCMKLYDGAVWKCIYPLYGDIKSTNNLVLEANKKLMLNGTNSTTYLTGNQNHATFFVNNQQLMQIGPYEVSTSRSLVTTGLRTNTISITGSDTLTTDNHKVIFTGSTAGSVITLPAANATNLGREYIIINHGSVNVGISPNYTTASGTLSSVGAGTVLELTSDGTVWRKTN